MPSPRRRSPSPSRGRRREDEKHSDRNHRRKRPGSPSVSVSRSQRWVPEDAAPVGSATTTTAALNASANAAPQKKPLRHEESLPLGWLSESGVMPKKKTEIVGVGAASIVSLQAQLFAAQEATRIRREGGVDATERKVRGASGADFRADPLFHRVNEGVDERVRRDLLSLKDTSAASVHASLERKAALYDKLSRGEWNDEEEARVLEGGVDFEMKQYVQSGDKPTEPRRGEVFDEASAKGEWAWAGGGRGGGGGGGGWESDARRMIADEKEEEERREAMRRTIDALAAETEAGRGKAASLKARRDAAMDRNRDKVKAAVLSKHLAKIRAEKAAAVGKGSMPPPPSRPPPPPP